MSLKLFVDDVRACPAGWHLARTVTEAVRILATMEVDAVSLDHDIIMQHSDMEEFAYHLFQLAANFDYVVPTQKASKMAMSGETFATVALYLAAMPDDLRPQTVFIHTANPTGAERMSGILDGKVKTIKRIFCDDYLLQLQNYAENNPSAHV